MSSLPPLTSSLVASQKQEAGREGCGEGEEDLPADIYRNPPTLFFIPGELVIVAMSFI